MHKFWNSNAPKIAIALAVVTGLALTGCSANSANGAADTKTGVKHLGTISVGVVPDATTAPLVVAANKGIFAKYGLTPEVKMFSSGGDASQSVSAGDVDVTANGQYSILNGAASGTKVDILARLNIANKQVGVVANSSIKSIKDLNGKNVGLQQGSTSVLYAILLQRKYGITFNIKNVGTDQTIAAFAKGQVDAYISWQPNLDRGVQAVKGSHVLAYSGDNDVMPLVEYLVASQKFAGNTAAVDAAVKAIKEASAWCEKHPKELTQLLASQFSVSADVIGKSVDVFDFSKFGWDDTAKTPLTDAAEVVKEERGVDVDVDSILKISDGE